MIVRLTSVITSYIASKVYLSTTDDATECHMTKGFTVCIPCKNTSNYLKEDAQLAGDALKCPW